MHAHIGITDGYLPLRSFFYFPFTCPTAASPSMLAKSNADVVGERQLPSFGRINKGKHH
jgi:hypothetical protein